MTQEIDFTDNILNSRDVQKRFDELESERQDLVDILTEAKEELDEAVRMEGLVEESAEVGEAQTKFVNADDKLYEWDEDNGEEFKLLGELIDELSGYVPDWDNGETLINRRYFVEYCMDLLSDIGDLPRDIPDYIVIDKEETAENLEQDYTSVELSNGEEFLAR